MFTFLLDTPTIIEITPPSSQAAATNHAPADTSVLTMLHDNPLLAWAAAGAVLLAIGWFAVRYWIVANRPSALKDIETPTINRMNTNALEHMVGESLEEAEAELEAKQHEPAPDDLLAVIPPEEDETDSKPDSKKT